MLEWHNYYRKPSATSPLRYIYNLQAWAQQWAEKLALTDVIEHRPPQPDPYNRMGENIYWKGLTEPNFVPSGQKRVTTLWFKEIHQYNYNNPGYNSKTSHFTQMVWKATIYVGCGYARSYYSKTTYVVCNYWPQGNTRGEFAEDVR
ncbi:Golgi-associated plant pathogenesis-related protein 1-like [Ixodes scapularis]|uniref:Golgi-associated plant pathogenesis-related protein 1-like n=1 Tax=Ixodes scapularis TaxID=6945 RepID=UPI001C3893C3|nr:Golgi-associated plant pathogenesis-related protein 1-like [Ixodes scapularis]